MASLWAGWHVANFSSQTGHNHRGRIIIIEPGSLLLLSQLTKVPSIMLFYAFSFPAHHNIIMFLLLLPARVGYFTKAAAAQYEIDKTPAKVKMRLKRICGYLPSLISQKSKLQRSQLRLLTFFASSPELSCFSENYSRRRKNTTE